MAASPRSGHAASILAIGPPSLEAEIAARLKRANNGHQ
jgi:hypothetical protein